MCHTFSIIFDENLIIMYRYIRYIVFFCLIHHNCFSQQKFKADYLIGKWEINDTANEHKDFRVIYLFHDSIHFSCIINNDKRLNYYYSIQTEKDSTFILFNPDSIPSTKQKFRHTLILRNDTLQIFNLYLPVRPENNLDPNYPTYFLKLKSI